MRAPPPLTNAHARMHAHANTHTHSMTQYKQRAHTKTGTNTTKKSLKCRVQGPKEGGKHVAFVGPKGELPAGDGTYGTSVPMGKAMDPANDILIAYKHVSARTSISSLCSGPRIPHADAHGLGSPHAWCLKILLFHPPSLLCALWQAQIYEKGGTNTNTDCTCWVCLHLVQKRRRLTVDPGFPVRAPSPLTHKERWLIVDHSLPSRLPLFTCLLPCAHAQNGRWLTVDHGFPVRTIIPGYIGGRTIKWLCSISVQEIESNNHYHYMDNRVLPSHVDQELATKEGGACVFQAECSLGALFVLPWLSNKSSVPLQRVCL